MQKQTLSTEFGQEWLLGMVERLCELIVQMQAMIQFLALNDGPASLELTHENNAHEKPGLRDEATQVRNERARLIEAWSQLEAEQRQFALQASDMKSTLKSKHTSTTTKHATGVPTITVTSQTPIDRLAQFEMLRSEYDRLRGHDST